MFTPKMFLVMACCLSASGCTDPEKTENVLQKNGYTQIEIGGYSWFGCGNEDTYSTEFSAKSPSGKVVNGVVCSGIWGKASTIRFFD